MGVKVAVGSLMRFVANCQMCRTSVSAKEVTFDMISLVKCGRREGSWSRRYSSRSSNSWVVSWEKVVVGIWYRRWSGGRLFTSRAWLVVSLERRLVSGGGVDLWLGCSLVWWLVSGGVELGLVCSLVWWWLAWSSLSSSSLSASAANWLEACVVFGGVLVVWAGVGLSFGEAGRLRVWWEGLWSVCWSSWFVYGSGSCGGVEGGVVRS